MKPLLSSILTLIATAAMTGVSYADVAWRTTPNQAVHGEQVDLAYAVDEATYGGYLLWYDARGNLTKYETLPSRFRAGTVTFSAEAPHITGDYQVYAYVFQRSGVQITRPRVVEIVDGTPTQTPTTVRFEVTIENTGGAGPLAPGAYALHTGSNPVYRSNSRASAGLEAMAEDGDPSGLERELMATQRVMKAGVFNTPDGANMPGPLMPGNSYKFVVEADPRSNPRLSLATMLAQTNDAFVGPETGTIDLFDRQGNALPARTIGVTSYDAGTEANQAFGQGADQAPRQAGPNTGGAESTVRPFTDSTRALPIASKVIDVKVRASNGAYTITFENVSAARGAITSPITPVFHAVHDGRFSMFTMGQPAPNNGLEALAEDGNASMLIATATSTPGVSFADKAGDGPVMPGSSVSFRVQPGRNATHLSVASMIGRTNDAFITAQSVALFDGNRALSARQLQDALNAALNVYDAGTEANETIGAGNNIAPNQAGPNTGPADSDNTVRMYRDATNDLASGFAALDVRHLGRGRFEVHVRNTSGNTAYPGRLTTAVVLTHASGANPLNVGGRASAGLAELAKDGGTSDWVRELQHNRSVGQVGTARSDGNGGWTMTIQADLTNRFLNLATMVVPSNDAFFGLGQGLELVTRRGFVRSDADLARDIAAMFMAYDAGAEVNEAGAAGTMQPPGVHNAGPREGSGRVRRYNDPVWALPSTSGLRIKIRPLSN